MASQESQALTKKIVCRHPGGTSHKGTHLARGASSRREAGDATGCSAEDLNPLGWRDVGSPHDARSNIDGVSGLDGFMPRGVAVRPLRYPRSHPARSPKLCPGVES